MGNLTLGDGEYSEVSKAAAELMDEGRQGGYQPPAKAGKHPCESEVGIMYEFVKINSYLKRIEILMGRCDLEKYWKTWTLLLETSHSTTSKATLSLLQRVSTGFVLVGGRISM